jgi:hypothetical protein
VVPTDLGFAITRRFEVFHASLSRALSALTALADQVMISVVSKRGAATRGLVIEWYSQACPGEILAT